MILVTGATGTTGGATVAALHAAGAPLRALVRTPSAYDAPDGVEVAGGTFEDAASLDAALAGVDHAYLVGASSPQQVELETAFVDAAVRNGVQHLVRLSVIGADQPGIDALRFGAHHAALEAVVRESGLGFTFLRPNGFMQNSLGFAETIASQSTFYSPMSPAAKVSYVDARDIGAVAATALTEPGHLGAAYTLTGPEALSDDDIAARLTSVLGREITHVLVPVEAAREAMLGTGYPEWNVDGLAELFAFYETGGAAGVAPDIEQVLGRPARSYAEFAADHRAAFGG